MNVRSLFPTGSRLIQYVLMIICLVISQQASAILVIPSSNPEPHIPMPSWFTSFSDYEIAYGQSGTSGAIVAVYDGDAAGITVTDGTNVDHFSFWNLNFIPSSFGLPTEISKPDVTLIHNGTKALVSLNTNVGAYVVEFDIVITATSVTVTPAILADPVNMFGLTADARIDGDITTDSFAISYIENDDVYYSLYEYNGSSYPQTFPNMLAATNPLAPGAQRYYSDVGITYENGNQPVVVVSYRNYDQFGSGNVHLSVDENHPYMSSQQLVFDYQIPVPFFGFNKSYTGYPKLGVENELTGVAFPTPVKWALSMVDWINSFSGPAAHLFYAHSDMGVTGTPYLLDDPYVSAPQIQMSIGTSCDWMPAVGLNDVFVAWNSVFAAEKSLGVMGPYNIGFPAYNTWEEISNSAAPYGIDSSSTSVYSDPVSGKYITSYSVNESAIAYKAQGNGSTGF